MTDIPQTAAPAEPTPGPWTFSAETGRVSDQHGETVTYVRMSDKALANGPLIASAPTLAAEVATLRERNAALEKALQGLLATNRDTPPAEYNAAVSAARALLAKEG